MKTILFLLTFIFIAQFCFSQSDVNYDESKVPNFKVPDPLKTFKGKKINNIKQWEKRRRPELLQFFTQNVYGEIPGELEISSFEIVEESNNAINGKAKRKQVEFTVQKGDFTLNYTMLLYLPNGFEKAPVFIGCNGFGNHAVTNDVNVIISEAWTPNNESFGIINNQLTEQSRGAQTNRWPIEKIIESGYGLATIFCGEIDPDKDDFTDGIHPFFYEANQQKPASQEWGSIAAWSWGLSRCMDYFEKDNDVDASKVIVFGHSRRGKTALWAGATDQRFAAVISNNSGCGGAALSKRRFGETVWRINTNFPHWFCKNFKMYSKNEAALPVDQHELIALIAPRPVYIASAEEDRWSDPRGEYLSAYYASPVYKLFDKEGVSAIETPEANQPIQNTVAYHIRTGKHDVTDYDWEQYIRWAREQVINK